MDSLNSDNDVIDDIELEFSDNDNDNHNHNDNSDKKNINNDGTTTKGYMKHKKKKHKKMSKKMINEMLDSGKTGDEIMDDFLNILDSQMHKFEKRQSHRNQTLQNMIEKQKQNNDSTPY